MSQIRTILIGTSLTEPSDLVVRAGLTLARGLGARIHLVHAWTPATFFGGPFIPDLPMDGVLEAEQEALRRQMDAQIRRVGIQPEEIAGLHLEPAPAHRAIVEIAENAGADLIVVGSSESPRMSRVFGSTADRVVRKATRPVFVIRHDFTVPPQRVLMPVDLSVLSAEAFRAGLEILTGMSLRQDPSLPLPEVEALYVVTPLDERLYSTNGEVARAEEHAREELDRFLNRHAEPTAWKVEPRVVRGGEVEDEVIGRAEGWKPGLVILGTHGRSGFERFLLGSVASALVRACPGNVLIVPPTAAREQASAFETWSKEAPVAG
jgi:nucleotide-binding universal stress UspA family protein